MRRAFLALAVLFAPACSLVTVQQEPFEPLDVTARPPPRKPPRVVLTASSIKISEKVQFKLGSAELLSDSFGLLDEVAGVMRENSQIERVQIEGHTDSTGSAKINKKLSKERAESVRAYLVKKGIEGGAPDRGRLRPGQADRRQRDPGRPGGQPAGRVQHRQAGSQEDGGGR